MAASTPNETINPANGNETSVADKYEAKVNGSSVGSQERNNVLVKMAERNPAIQELVKRLVKE